MHALKPIFLVILLSLNPIFSKAQSQVNINPQVSQFSTKWGDQGDGTYRNPVIPGDYSDLDAIRVGSDYYAISSTLQYSPGVVILHSKDLVNWQILSHVVDDITVMTPELNWDKMNRYGKGVWAGSIRYYKGKFWIYFGTPDDGFFMSSATNPAGSWEPLHAFWKIKGWDDCCSFCDDDGQLYFIASNFALDPKNNKKYNIHLFKMTPDGKNLIMESDSIIHQSSGSEANKLYKINGVYYHYYSETNREGRVIMMERSKNIYGPFETKQLNHVNKTDRQPNQGGLMQTEKGDWWFFTHHGASGNWDGRVASLLPVTWIDGWPVIGEVGSDKIGNMVYSAKKPIQSTLLLKIQTDDDFNKPNLGVQWEWNYQPRKDKWSLKEHSGFLRLHAFMPINPTDNRKIILRAGNTLTQRSMRTSNNEVTVKMDLKGMTDGQYTGLTHYASTYSTFGVCQNSGIKSLVYNNNGRDSTGIQITGNTLFLRSKWGYDGISSYAYSFDGKNYITFGETYQLSWGSYRGDRIGIFNYNTKEEKGFVDVNWFTYKYASTVQ
jgi:beta-xylosidase